MSAPLHAALTSFMAAAESKDAGQIVAALAAVVECQRQLGKRAHPQLQHYLEKRSYQKALEFLNDQPSVAGTCR